jgi:predicted TPR repeat methyltransferase
MANVVEMNGTANPINPIPEDTHQRILESRKVLYRPDTTGKDYVSTYDDYWAEKYDEDGVHLGFQSWEFATKYISMFVPDKNALILDYCGGTGQVGKRLKAVGYNNIYYSDGSVKMAEQAKTLGIYKKMFHEIVERGQKAHFLEECVKNGMQFDSIFMSMSLSEFETVVQQICREGLKPGGVFIAIESVPHLTQARLDGIFWCIDEGKKPDGCLEVVHDCDDHPHDTFTDHKMKVLVVKRKAA